MARTRERIERGLQKKGFLVAYFMFNHDCNAMGAGEEHPAWVFRPPKVRLGFPHSRRQIARKHRVYMCVFVFVFVLLCVSLVFKFKKWAPGR